ncbi:MAG: DUF2283 domain-containing protein [Candidatus Omnitrophica bacterium]|nr:DUF2283 domain-containing protein [Candidatus Omnitrophota bacterium]
MKGTQGSMNIDFQETYDQEDDIYYVSFKTGEPSYVVEMDDVLLLEFGIFSNLPTGFRILGFEKNKVRSIAIGVMIQKVKKAIEDASKKLPTVRTRENQVEQALEKVLA